MTLTSHQRQFNFSLRLSSPLLFFYSTRSSERCLHCGDPDRCGGPRWQVQDREKSERLICPPADVGFGSLEASPLTCPSFGGGSSRTLAAASCHLGRLRTPCSTALLGSTAPWHVSEGGPRLLSAARSEQFNNSCAIMLNNNTRVAFNVVCQRVISAWNCANRVMAVCFCCLGVHIHLYYCLGNNCNK